MWRVWLSAFELILSEKINTFGNLLFIILEFHTPISTDYSPSCKQAPVVKNNDNPLFYG
jgi:hypothetical protein